MFCFMLFVLLGLLLVEFDVAFMVAPVIVVVVVVVPEVVVWFVFVVATVDACFGFLL